jgi:hypothetical protein
MNTATVLPAATLPASNSNFQAGEPTIQDYEGTVMPSGPLVTDAPVTATTTRPLGPPVSINDLPLLDCKAFNAEIRSGNQNVEEVVVLDKETYFPLLLLVSSPSDLHSRHPDELRGKKAVLMNYQYLPQGQLPSGEEFFFLPRKHFGALKSVDGEPNGRAYFPLTRHNQVPSFSYNVNEAAARFIAAAKTENAEGSGSESISVLFIVLMVAIGLMTTAAVVSYRKGPNPYTVRNKLLL